jgi:hypothetical protein
MINISPKHIKKAILVVYGQNGDFFYAHVADYVMVP